MTIDVKYSELVRLKKLIDQHLLYGLGQGGVLVPYNDKLAWFGSKLKQRIDLVSEEASLLFIEKKETSQVMNASVDSHKNLIMKDNGSYAYSQEGMIKLNKEIREAGKVLDDTVIAIDPIVLDLDNDDFKRADEIPKHVWESLGLLFLMPIATLEKQS